MEITDLHTEALQKIKNDFGIEFTDIKNGYARAILPVQPQLKNHMGIVYGGILYNLADITAGVAFFSDDCLGATATGNMQYLRSNKNMKAVICEANAVKRGKKIDFIDVKLTDEAGKELCRGQFVFARM